MQDHNHSKIGPGEMCTYWAHNYCALALSFSHFQAIVIERKLPLKLPILTTSYVYAEPQHMFSVFKKLFSSLVEKP